MAATRRTHIVRITDPDTPPDPANPSGQGNYIDVEVLDAIAFRTTGNKEVILSLDAKKSTPYIVDKTGGGHDKSPSKATQRTHMKRVQSSDGTSAIDVEIVDCWAATDQNGGSWILDMQPGSGGGTAYNISDGSGDAKSTRRQHNEIVSSPFGKAKADAAKSYVTSVRTDNIAFRKVNGHEVILSCPSCDDTNAQGVDFKRADTHTTPQGYDPSDTSDAAVKPPSLDDSGDQHNYVCFVKGDDGKSKSIMTVDEKIDMGPFWWIRKVESGGNYLVILFQGAETDTHVQPWGDQAMFNNNPNGGDGSDLRAGYSCTSDGVFVSFDVNTGGSHTSGIYDITAEQNNYKIKARDIASTLTISGGKKISGFCLKTVNNNSNQSALFFLDVGKLGAGDIPIEIDTGSEQVYGVQMFSFKKGVIKPGVVFSDVQFAKSEDNINLPGGSNWNITLNAKTLLFNHPPDTTKN